MNQDQLLIAKIEDKISQSAGRYMITAGDFLDMHQRKICQDYFRSVRLPVKAVFYGGYQEAERCMPVFLPDYASTEDLEELLRIVRVSVPKGSRRLTHRDYLGSLLSLGIDREVTGDILVRNPDEKSGGGADIIVQSEIADFIKLNYDKAGRTSLCVEVLPVNKLDRGSVKIEEKTDTVASLRLDSIVASAFGLSRAKAAEAIRRGIVSVNSVEVIKIDTEISEGDKIVLRGKGKAVLAEVGGTTKKDRVRILLNIYR